MRTSADSSQAERACLESCCSASSAHGTARTEAQRLGLLAFLATSNIKCRFGGPCLVPPAALLQKSKLLQIARSQMGLAWKAVAQPLLHLALLSQRHTDWGCLLVLPPQTSNVDLRVRAGCLRQPCSKKQTSADRSQPERASLESCCSASSAHGTARTEAQRLGRLSCLASSNFKRKFGGSVPGASDSHAEKSKLLQIAHSQKELAWKSVAQPLLPFALLAQRHRNWSCFLVLLPQTSDVG